MCFTVIFQKPSSLGKVAGIQIALQGEQQLNKTKFKFSFYFSTIINGLNEIPASDFEAIVKTNEATHQRLNTNSFTVYNL